MFIRIFMVFGILGKISSSQHFEIFSPKIGDNLPKGDNLHEMSNPILGKK